MFELSAAAVETLHVRGGVCETEHEEPDESCSPCVLPRLTAAWLTSHTPTPFVLQPSKRHREGTKMVTHAHTHTREAVAQAEVGTQGRVWVERGRI